MVLCIIRYRMYMLQLDDGGVRLGSRMGARRGHVAVGIRRFQLL